MAYVDYSFYQDEYLKGKESKVSETDFAYYEQQAETIIKDMTLNKSDTYIDGNEVKMATCAAIDQIYSAIGDNSGEDDSDVIPAGVSSEHVGEYTVSYLNNSLDERLKTAYKTARMSAKIYLGPTGLLFRGIGGN